MNSTLEKVRFWDPHPVLNPFYDDGDSKDERNIVCEDFLAYCKAMQLPDPTKVEMSEETNQLVTRLVNEGRCTPWEAMEARLRSLQHAQYQFDEQGKEFISFPEPEEMLDLLGLSGEVDLHPDQTKRYFTRVFFGIQQTENGPHHVLEAGDIADLDPTEAIKQMREKFAQVLEADPGDLDVGYIDVMLPDSVVKQIQEDASAN